MHSIVKRPSAMYKT